MSLIEFDGRKPKVDPSVFLAPASWIIGDVTLREGVGVWTGSIIRGDDDRVVIGSRTMVLENSFIEAPTGSPVEVGEESIISHGAIVHGSRIGSHVLIGIGAIVLDRAVIGEGSIIGSGALVPPGAVIPERQLVLGVPGKPVREVGEAERRMVSEELERLIAKSAKYKAIYSGVEKA